MTKFFLALLTAYFCTGYIHAQDCSVTLLGTYQLDRDSNDDGLYNAFVFDGAGKVEIDASFTVYNGDFFQVGDTVIVYPDKSIFKFLKKDDNTLVGVNIWVKDQVFKRMENDTVKAPTQLRSENYAAQFYKYYILTDRDAPGLSTYMNITIDSAIRQSMNKLCDEGLPKACITMANAYMLNSSELSSYISGKADENNKMPPNKDVFDYFVKAIELDDLDAVAQLGAYILMLGHKEEAIKILNKGCELGHRGCCISLAALEMELVE